MAGPGGGALGGIGGRPPNPTINGFYDLAEYGYLVAEAVADAVNFAMLPLDSICDDWPVLDALFELLPPRLGSMTIMSCVLGGSLLVIISFHIVRFLRQVFT